MTTASYDMEDEDGRGRWIKDLKRRIEDAVREGDAALSEADDRLLEAEQEEAGEAVLGPLRTARNKAMMAKFGRLAGLAAEIHDRRGDPDVTEAEMDGLRKCSSIINEEVYFQLKGYAYEYASEKWGRMFDEHSRQDLVQEMFLEVYSQFYKYNGKNMMTTFSKPHLLHGGQRHLSFVSHKKAYENEVSNKIKKAQSRLLAMGYEQDQITPTLLHEETGLSEAQIAQSLETDRLTKHAEFNPDVDLSGRSSQTVETPEKAYERHETERVVSSIMSMLLPYERYLLEASAGNYGTNMTRLANLGTDQDLVALIKEAGMGHLVETGEVILKESLPNETRTIAFRGEYVPKEDVKRLTESARKHALQTPEARRRLNETLASRPSFQSEIRTAQYYTDAAENLAVLEEAIG